MPMARSVLFLSFFAIFALTLHLSSLSLPSLPVRSPLGLPEYSHVQLKNQVSGPCGCGCDGPWRPRRWPQRRRGRWPGQSGRPPWPWPSSGGAPMTPWFLKTPLCSHLCQFSLRQRIWTNTLWPSLKLAIRVQLAAPPQLVAAVARVLPHKQVRQLIQLRLLRLIRYANYVLTMSLDNL